MNAKIPILIGACLLFPAVALASGLSVSPARLDFALADGRQAQKTMAVMNPTADVMVFEVYADEFKNMITTNPESFTLEAGARKEISIAISAKNINSPFSPSFQKRGQGGVISTNLSVIGKPLAENKVNVAAGAKIPITITVNPSLEKSQPYVQYGILILAGLIILLLLLRFNKKLP